MDNQVLIKIMYLLRLTFAIVYGITRCDGH